MAEVLPHDSPLGTLCDLGPAHHHLHAVGASTPNWPRLKHSSFRGQAVIDMAQPEGGGVSGFLVDIPSSELGGAGASFTVMAVVAMGPAGGTIISLDQRNVGRDWVSFHYKDHGYGFAPSVETGHIVTGGGTETLHTDLVGAAAGPEGAALWTGARTGVALTVERNTELVAESHDGGPVSLPDVVPFYLGSTSIFEPIDGVIVEVVMVRDFRDANEKAELEGYLAARWGLPLPSTHPFFDGGM